MTPQLDEDESQLALLHKGICERRLELAAANGLVASGHPPKIGAGASWCYSWDGRRNARASRVRWPTRAPGPAESCCCAASPASEKAHYCAMRRSVPTTTTCACSRCAG